MITITRADPSAPALVALIEAHNAHGDAHYPAESNHHLTPADYAASTVRLWAAWEGESCLGMAGLDRFGDRQGEIKSMHVRAEARGKGVAAALLNHLMATGRAEGLTALWLETGSRDASAAARRLYERAGFSYCPPFGSYAEDPESVFMTRHL